MILKTLRACPERFFIENIFKKRKRTESRFFVILLIIFSPVQIIGRKNGEEKRYEKAEMDHSDDNALYFTGSIRRVRI